ncbi:unnamed protein product, partial [Schistosoma margrebowiei]
FHPNIIVHIFVFLQINVVTTIVFVYIIYQLIIHHYCYSVNSIHFCYQSIFDCLHHL